MFVLDSAYDDQLTRWGLTDLAGAMAFPAQIGPPDSAPRWQQVAGGSTNACYRLSADHGDPAWRFHTLYLKPYHFSPPTWRYLLQRSRARKEARNLTLLAALGVPCPRVVAAGDRRQAVGRMPAIVLRIAAVLLVLATVVLATGALLLSGTDGKLPRNPNDLAEAGKLLALVAVKLRNAGLAGVIVAAGTILGLSLLLGLIRLCGRGYLAGGALLVTAIEPSQDLFKFARAHWKPAGRAENDQHRQVRRLASQLAAQTAVVHRSRFVHRDLKFRNLLVCSPRDGQPAADGLRIAWIDCPSGGRMIRGPWLTRGQMKDLANLDRNAAPYLTRTQRYRFLRDYLLIRDGRVSRRTTRRIVRWTAEYNARWSRRRSGDVTDAMGA